MNAKDHTNDDQLDLTGLLADHSPKVRRTQRRINPSAFSTLVKLLQKGDHSVDELARHTGLSTHTVRAYCKSFVINELAYIFGWDRDSLGRDSDPRYKWGPGVNMPRRSRDAGEPRKKARLHAATLNFRKTGRVHRAED